MQETGCWFVASLKKTCCNILSAGGDLFAHNLRNFFGPRSGPDKMFEKAN